MQLIIRIKHNCCYVQNGVKAYITYRSVRNANRISPLKRDIEAA